MRCLERQGKATQHNSPKVVIFQRNISGGILTHDTRILGAYIKAVL